jgi:hypothetical protein
MISKLDEGDGTEGSLSSDHEGSQAVLMANADESEPELAWADSGIERSAAKFSLLSIN